MAKNVLPVDFQDDILAESMNGRRKYQMITNSDGTVSFVDVTEYTQVGSNFGQAQVNATNEAVNESADKNKIIDDKDDLVANSQAGMMAGALAVKAIREELNQNMNGIEYNMGLNESMDITSGTILDWANTHPAGCTAMVTAGYKPSDAPESTYECALFLIGHDTRKVVVAYTFGGTPAYMGARAIYNSNWLSEWN